MDIGSQPRQLQKLQSSSGWKFHSLEDNALATSKSVANANGSEGYAANINMSGDSNGSNVITDHQRIPTQTPMPTTDATPGDEAAKSSSSSTTTATATLPDLVRDFDADGLLTLSSLMTPQFTNELRNECMEIFDGVLEWMFLRGEADFKTGYRLKQSGRRKEEHESNNGKDTTTTTNKSATSKYEYPLKVGLKNGYRELVMRSPGRYELALLVDDYFPSSNNNNNFDNNETGRRRSFDADADADCHDYNGKRLLSKAMLEHAKELESMKSIDDPTNPTLSSNDDDNQNERKITCNQNNEVHEKSCLKKLLQWIQNCSHHSNQINDNGNSNGDNNKKQQQYYAIDEKNMERFMTLVGAIFPSSSHTNDGRCKNNHQNIDSNDNGNNRKETSEYYLCNFSLLVATPGCPTQSWHADGGHVSLAKHEKCHVFNVFVPLVDVPLSMGPTELRPGTHYHTRNLAPMMLAARARKTLRAAAVMEMRRGDALVFDYRILHRGRANVSDELENNDTDDSNNREDEVCIGETGGGVCGGKHRPVLVMTFARRWFVDVCNFPKWVHRMVVCSLCWMD